MTVIDDQLFGRLLVETGDGFEIPENGMAEILRRSLGDASRAETDAEAESETAAETEAETEGATETNPLLHSVRGTLRSHRLLAVAASVVVLAVAVAGVSTALSHHTVGPKATSSIALGHATAPATHGAASTGSAEQGPLGVPSANAAAPKDSTFKVSGGAVSAQAPASTAAPTTGNTSPATAPTGKASYIEQTGTLTLQVGLHGVAPTISALRNLAAANGGYVANSQTQANAGVPGVAPSGSITLQIPEANFPAALHSAEALGKNLQLSTKATNVTGNYVNLQAQIAALQTSLTQYELIMTKAQSIGDILSVQSQVNALQTQIQQLQGQLQLLNSETSYSTLTVQVQQKGVVIHNQTPHHTSGLSRAWHNSVHGFADGVEGIISIAGPLLFALICIGVLLLAGRVSWRRWQRHNL